MLTIYYVKLVSSFDVGENSTSATEDTFSLVFVLEKRLDSKKPGRTKSSTLNVSLKKSLKCEYTFVEILARFLREKK